MGNNLFRQLIERIRIVHDQIHAKSPVLIRLANETIDLEEYENRLFITYETENDQDARKLLLAITTSDILQHFT